MTYTAVPVFSHGDAGPPEGGQGVYDVVVSLAVPGRDVVMLNIDLDAETKTGDSQIEGVGGTAQVFVDAGHALDINFIVNDRGRLAQMRFAVEAKNFADADTFTHNIVMPLLSRLSFETNTALDIRAIMMIERSTSIQRISGRVAGNVVKVKNFEGLMTPELGPYLASYREGMNADSPIYQALAFFKVVEGVSSFHVNRTRSAKAKAASPSTVPDPDSHKIPSTEKDLPDQDEWTIECFKPYLGKTFAEMKVEFQIPIRDAVAHIKPRMDFHTPDNYEDIMKCRTAVPVLRYMARVLIEAEIDDLRNAPKPSP